MSSTTNLPELKRHLQRQFSTAVPNGWLLGWNERRLESELAAAVRPLRIQNCTSFDHAFCNRFEVLADGGDVRHDYVLSIRISNVCDLFCLHWMRYKRSGNKAGGMVDSPGTSEASALERKIREMLERHGLQEIPDEWMDEPVPDVRLELAGRRNVTISKCAFEDYEG
jgi:hypothetical protein